MALLGSLTDLSGRDLGNPQQQQKSSAGKPGGVTFLGRGGPTTITEPVKPACAACSHFVAPPEMPEGAHAGAWQAAHKHVGKCRRFPQTVDKAPDDRCGEFLQEISHAR